MTGRSNPNNLKSDGNNIVYTFKVVQNIRSLLIISLHIVIIDSSEMIRFLGSVASSVVTYAHCPVMVVK
jgi:hypothetical protein